MGSSDPTVWREFAPPPPDDRDAIISIVISMVFLGFVLVGVIWSIF